MKKWIFNLLVLIGLSTTALAQSGDKHGKQIEAVKVEYLTRRLNLSPEEAQRFWPVFNNYQRELSQVFQQRKRDRQAQRSGGAPVDEIKYDAQILEIRKRYKKEFSNVLPEQKVSLLYQAERDFREQLIKQLGERRQGQE